MFFIYGGGFLLGASEMYPGAALATAGHVVVVNFNYRVGTFGFLATMDTASKLSTQKYPLYFTMIGHC